MQIKSKQMFCWEGVHNMEEDYKQYIIDMVNEIEDIKFLWKIYSFVKVFYERKKIPEKQA